jgi:hypothetical protein
VTVAGNGAGSVSAPAGVEGDGINCGTGCSEHYYRTTTNPMVTLTASYDSTAVTPTWSAPCAGSTTSCTVTLSAATTVSVTFTKRTFTVTITKSAEGSSGATGTVTSTNGISCGNACSVTVNAGDTVSLTAAPGSGFYFSTFTGGGCPTGSLTCTTSAISANTTIDAKFTQANIIFTTSTTYTVDQFASNGNGNPQVGADAFCKARAAASNMPNMAGRTWTSLITLGTVQASSSAGAARLGTKRGWVRPDGKPFGDTPASFFAPGVKVFYPPAISETGSTITDGQSNTGALGDGCVGWTSTLISDYRAGGVPTAGGGGWDTAYGFPCVYPLHLYCMSIDYTAIVTAPGPSAIGNQRVAFFSDETFTPAGSNGMGMAAADALCAQEASSAGLAGTFKALLATPTASAISRFGNGATWVRPDGVTVGTLAQFSATNSLLLTAPIEVSATLRYFGVSSPLPWTGASTPSAVGTAATTCTVGSGTPWSAPAGTSGVSGITGRAWFSDSEFFQDNNNADCGSSGYQLYCLQQ